MPESAPIDPWVKRLRSADSAERNRAIADLRTKLEKTLGRTFVERYGHQVSIDDIIQEALLKILDSLDSFAGRSRFLTWAVAIATRLGLTELRRRRYRDVSLDLDGEHLRLPALVIFKDGQGDKATAENLVARLNDLIATELTDRQRIAIRASLDELPVDEIAVRLGSNRNAVYKLLHDARVRLKEGLLNSGVSQDDLIAVTDR